MSKQGVPTFDHEEHLQLALASSRMVLWNWNLLTNDCVRSANSLEVLGISRDESPEVYLSLVHPADQRKVKNALTLVLEGKAPFDLDYRLLVREGEEIWIADKAILRRDADGRPVALVGASIDVTERKNQEEALRLSERFNRSIIQSSRDCIKTLSVAGDLLSINDHGREVLGVADIKDVLNTSWIDFWKGADRDAARKAVQDAAAGKTGTFVGQFPIAGSPHWFDVLITPILDGQAKPEKLLAVSRDVTERVLAENARRESEARLQAMLDNGPTVAFLKDVEGRYLLVNTHFEQMFQLCRAEIAGKTDFELFPREFAQQYRDNDLLIIASGKSIEFEETAPHPDGPHTYISIKFPLIDGSGKVYAVGGLATDITDRKRSEDAVRQSEELFKSLSSCSPVGIFITDTQGRCTYTNPRCQEIAGFGAAEALGDGWANFVHPDDRESVFNEWAETTANGLPFQREFRFRERSGKVHWVFVRSSPLVMAGKGVVGHVGTIEDVTERRRAEDAMRANEQRLEQLMQLLPAAVYTCDMEGCITFFNRRAVELWGGEPRAIEKRRFCGSHALRRLDGAALSPEQTPMAISLREGLRIRNEEAVVIRPDGSEVVVSVNVDPLRDEEGWQCGAINVLQDITAMKNTQAALEEADRRKDQFLAMLAHELRNPLAPIRNAAQILSLVGPANPQLRFTQDIINRQVAHLGRLVDDLLDVSRITQGKVSLDKERVAVSTIIGRAVETVRPLLEARQHHLTISVAPEVAYVEGDLTRLAQVLANVLHNAAKYTETGGHVEIISESCDGETVIIRVRDTGIGIPPEFLPRVFDLFAQAGRSLDRTQGGLGVGLTLARDLVHLHAGSIEVRSAGAGCGTEVEVRLPTIGEPQKESSGTAMPKPDMQNQRLKILVVDDNVDSAESLTLLFRLQGQDVDTAFDGPSALQLADMSRPNVVLLDIGLPGMDGYEVARLMRQNPKTALATIIAITGYGQEEDRRRSKQAGIDHHLTKPVDLDVLQSLVRSIFRKGAVA